MPNYRRAWHPGGTYFFTITLLQRQGSDLLIRHIENLRAAVSEVGRRFPFRIHGWVVLPDHIHCLIELPPGDSNFAVRIMRIKQVFSRSIPRGEYVSDVRQRRGERGIWQRRYWEHLIRDEEDFNAHMDYIHFNPVKHGLVTRASDWPYSTFHRCVAEGMYDADWAGGDRATMHVAYD